MGGVPFVAFHALYLNNLIIIACKMAHKCMILEIDLHKGI